MKTISKSLPTVLLLACLGAMPSAAAAVNALANPAAVAPAQPQADAAKAELMLGDQLLAAPVAPGSLDAALSHYRRAAELGDTGGLRRLGEAKVLGRDQPVDVSGGFKLLADAGDLGDTDALILLADFYARGLAGAGERQRAIAIYESAAELGRTLALDRLGVIYLTGRIVDPDIEKAASYFHRAIDAGRTSTMVRLGKGMAEGKFGGIGTPAQGIAMLKEADRQDLAEAVLALSDCYFYGQGVDKDPQAALALLQAALEAGNVKAGRRLVALYRDGRRGSVERNREKAAALLEQIASRLDAASLQLEQLLMQASSASGASAYAGIASGLASMTPAQRPDAIRKIRSVNPNAYIYLVQIRLSDLGLYNSKSTGQLSQKTARAMYQFCSTRELPDTCKKGPLTGPVTETISYAF